jgi:hypothetical protein
MKFPMLPSVHPFASTSISSQAETHCHGSIAGLRPRMVEGALVVIPVKINQSGVFDFMVDAGSQLNVIDRGRPGASYRDSLDDPVSAGDRSPSHLLRHGGVGVFQAIPFDTPDLTIRPLIWWELVGGFSRPF